LIFHEELFFVSKIFVARSIPGYLERFGFPASQDKKISWGGLIRNELKNSCSAGFFPA